MNPCAADELSHWLTGKLSESPVSEYIPSTNLALVTAQIVAACYQDGRLETADLLAWFENEFQVPRETLMPVLSGLKKEAAALGVTLLLPWETHASASAAASTPDRPTAPPRASAPRPDRPAPAASAPVQEDFPSAQHLTDAKYLERSVYDYVISQQHPDDPLLARMLVTYFQLGPEEVELLRTIVIDNPGDSLAAWVLRLDGLFLGLKLAELLVEDMPERQPEWFRGVRQLQGRVSDITTAILARQQKARADQDPAMPQLQVAWTRVRQTADQLDRLMKTLAGKEAHAPVPSPSVPRPARPAAGKESEPMEAGRRKLILAATVVVAVATIASALYFSGIFSMGTGKTEVKLDTAGLALPLMESYTQGAAMVVVVDDQAWFALPEADRTKFLLDLYDRAVKVQASQVQARAGNQVLAQAWSREKIKLFARKR